MNMPTGGGSDAPPGGNQGSGAVSNLGNKGNQGGEQNAYSVEVPNINPGAGNEAAQQLNDFNAAQARTTETILAVLDKT